MSFFILFSSFLSLLPSLFILLLTLSLPPLLSPSSPTYTIPSLSPLPFSSLTYLGCYSDNADVQKRTLPHVFDTSPDQSIIRCTTLCAARGFPYAGLEYSTECYCGSHSPSNDKKIAEEKCENKCLHTDGDPSGEHKCGGSNALSIYSIPAESLGNPSKDDPRPLVCLVMILKNEAHTILDTLRTVVNDIDCWYILDTGSDDNTDKIAQDYFTQNRPQIPGKVFYEKFIDYGATRNRILEIAKEQSNPVFTLMLSADERVVSPSISLRPHLIDHRYSLGPQHGAYPVVMNTGIKFDSVRLARVDSGWRYRARVHEYLAPPTGPYITIYRPLIEIEVLFNATDGPRRFQSQYFIKKILEEDLERDPMDTRSMYYLARTNSGINNHSAAFYYYNLLASRSKWDEEVYHGMVMKAIESKFIPEVRWQDRQQWLLDAYAYRPNNMDALHALAQDHYDSGRPHLAYLYMKRGVELPLPPNLNAIENVLLRPIRYLYDYEGHRLLGFAAKDIGEYKQCVDSFKKVLLFNPKDDIVAGRVRLCEEKVAKGEGQKIEIGGAMNHNPNREIGWKDVPGMGGNGMAGGTGGVRHDVPHLPFDLGKRTTTSPDDITTANVMGMHPDTLLTLLFYMKILLFSTLIVVVFVFGVRRYKSTCSPILPTYLFDRKVKV